MSRIERKVKGCIQHVTGDSIDCISNDASFKELGIDSLDRLDLINQLEDVFCRDIPTEDFNEITTVAQIITYIEQTDLVDS